MMPQFTPKGHISLNGRFLKFVDRKLFVAGGTRCRVFFLLANEHNWMFSLQYVNAEELARKRREGAPPKNSEPSRIVRQPPDQSPTSRPTAQCGSF
jgi:hypothetical protein